MPKKYETDQEAASRLADALADLPDNWIMCRDVRHSWEVSENFFVSRFKGKKVDEVKRVLTCSRCGTERRETYLPSNRFGLEKVKSTYAYPENYQMHGVPRGVKPQWMVQRESYRRALASMAAAKAG